jgi:flavin reductase (DIM6/NTAB) family NADH-FMN oxidoreductase RutF
MDVDPTESADMYRIVSSLVVPRPIGWISTRAADGTDNLAPYSFFQVLNESSPPVVMFAAGDREDGRPKDSATNARATGGFVHNLVTRDRFEEMHRSSDAIPAAESEFAHADVDLEAAETVSAPRVRRAKAHFECSLYDDARIGDRTVVMGEIQHVHVDDALLTDGRVDVREVDAVGRLTGDYYSAIEPFPAAEGPP